MKEELKTLGIGSLIVMIALAIAFRSEGTGIIRIGLAFIWIFILPGWAVLLSLKFPAPVRFILSFPVSIAILGTLSYYLGLMGVHVKVHGWTLPLLVILAGIAFARKKLKSRQSEPQSAE